MAANLELVINARDNASGVLKGIDDSAGGLGGTLKRVGEIAGGFLAANVIGKGASALTGFVSGSVEAAKDLGESLNAVNVVFGTASDKVLAWGKANATAFGLSNREFNQLVTPIGAMLQNFGFSAEDAADQSVNLAKRAADMASVFNVDVGEALQAIQAGLRGEADPLERFGVGLNAAAIQAKALEQTGKGSAEALTDMEKKTAALALIMEQTADVEGDFANTSDSLANAQRIAAAKTEELQAKLGQKLLPVSLFVTKAKLALAQVLVDKVVPALERMGQIVSSVLSPALAAVQNIILPLVNLFGAALTGNIQKAHTEFVKLPRPLWDIAQVVFDLGSFIRQKLLPPIGQFADFVSKHKVELGVFAAAFGVMTVAVSALAGAHVVQAQAATAAAVAEGLALGPILLIAAAAAALVVGMVVLEKKTQFFSKQVWPTLKAAFQETAKVVIPLLEDALETLVQGVEDLQQIWKEIKPTLESVGQAIGSVLIPVFEKVGQFLKEHPILIGVLAGVILTIIAPWLAVVAVIVLVLAKWDEIKALFTETIPQAIDSLINKVKEVPVIGEIVTDAFNTIWTAVQLYLDLVLIQVKFALDTIQNTFAFWKAVFTGDWDAAWNALKDQAAAIWNALSGIFGAALDAIKSIADSKLQMIKGIGFDIGHAIVGAFSSAISTGGSLARGAINGLLSILNEGLDAIADGLAFIKKVVDAFPGGNPFGNTMQAAIDALRSGIPLINVGSTPFQGTGGASPVYGEFAQGGIVTKPTLALIGEAGPEAVVPLKSAGTMPVGNTYVFNYNPTISTASQAEMRRAALQFLSLVRKHA